MSIRAVFIDFGGVLIRTEDQAPRERLARRLGIPFETLYEVIFESESSHLASLGRISEEQHRQACARTLGVPRDEMGRVWDEFFAGDQADMELYHLLVGLHPLRQVGLISNAWSGLRALITRAGWLDAFDALIVSAEVGIMKPDPRIYQLALEALGVDPQEAVFVDDTLANIEAARMLGMAVIHFTRPQAARQELTALLDESRWPAR
jgi:putative hydrolase of the HAD superfamily